MGNHDEPLGDFTNGKNDKSPEDISEIILTKKERDEYKDKQHMEQIGKIDELIKSIYKGEQIEEIIASDYKEVSNCLAKTIESASDLTEKYVKILYSINPKKEKKDEFTKTALYSYFAFAEMIYKSPDFKELYNIQKIIISIHPSDEIETLEETRNAVIEKFKKMGWVGKDYPSKNNS